jgi:hypothetical protein
VTVPEGNSYEFRVRGPVGRSKVIAIIVPDKFNIEALNVAKETKGFGVEARLPYLQNLIYLIQNASGAKGFEVHPIQSPSKFGFGGTEYDVLD